MALDRDDELMLMVRDHDAAAFTELTETHQAPLCGWFFRQTRDWGLSEDLAQEAMLKVWDKAGFYIPSGLFKAWLYRIARNLLIDTSRRQKTDAMSGSALGRNEDDRDDLLARLEGDDASPECVANNSELAAMAESMLDDLPDDQKMVFILYIYSGMSLPEIAAAMEDGLATTKSRLRLAREKLAEAMSRRGVSSLAG